MARLLLNPLAAKLVLRRFWGAEEFGIALRFDVKLPPIYQSQVVRCPQVENNNIPGASWLEIRLLEVNRMLDRVRRGLIIIEASGSCPEFWSLEADRLDRVLREVVVVLADGLTFRLTGEFSGLLDKGDMGDKGPMRDLSCGGGVNGENLNARKAGVCGGDDEGV